MIATSTSSILAVLIATSFASGLNVYATVASLGLLARTDLVSLPPSLQTLQSWWVIGACAVLFLIELVGDKIPVFDLIWNALHTFVRVPVAVLLSYFASAGLSPEMTALCTIVGGLVALAAHGGKIALRAAVTPSPEPVSNIVLSFGEDVVAVFLTWLATRHPYIAAGIALAAVALVIVLLNFVIRSIRALFRGAERALETQSWRGQ